MNRVNPEDYTFVTKDNYDHPAIMMIEGEYKGVAWAYTKVSIPKEDGGSAKLTFNYEILDNAGLPWESVDTEEFITLMGDILADQIDEQLESGKLQYI